MNEKFLILRRSIESDLATIEKLYEALDGLDVGEDASSKDLVFAAYTLHGLYTAFENIFRSIAAAFENHLDPAGWHRQLLQRMRLDLTPLRPAVIHDEVYEHLREMLGFRHFFRAAYGADIDPVRLREVLRRALKLRALYKEQIERFLGFVNGME